MNEIFIGSGITAFGVLLTWWLTNATTRRVQAKGDQATLRMQADALIVAVGEVRSLTSTNKVLWDGKAERLRSLLLAAVVGSGGFARVLVGARAEDRESWLPIAAGLGAAFETFGRDRREAKRAAAAFTPVMTRVTAAAAPLLRYPDPHVTATAEALFAAAFNEEAPAVLDRAMHEFGRAVSRSLEARPSWWRRTLPSLRRTP